MNVPLAHQQQVGGEEHQLRSCPILKENKLLVLHKKSRENEFKPRQCTLHYSCASRSFSIYCFQSFQLSFSLSWLFSGFVFAMYFSVFFRTYFNIVYSKFTHHKLSITITIWSRAHSYQFSFAQWHYHSLWSSTEAWWLLIENFSQYPAIRSEIPADMQCLKDPSGSIYSNENLYFTGIFLLEFEVKVMLSLTLPVLSS